MPKYLVKFVNSMHLPNIDQFEKCSIRIGTFLDYRETEDQKRRDRDEGQRGLDLILKKPCNQLIQLNGYSDCPLKSNGEFTAEYHLLVHEHLYDFNAWIFSCSIISDLTEIESIKKKFDCDSYYFISDIDKFFNAIQHSLAKSIKNNPYAENGLPRIIHQKGDNVFIDGWKQQITYTNNTKGMTFTYETLTNFLNSTDLTTVDQKLWFTKSKIFEDEKEYRFALFGSGSRSKNKRYNINEKFTILDVDVQNAISFTPVNIE